MGGKRKTSGRQAPYYVVGFDFLRPLDELRDLPHKGTRALATHDLSMQGIMVGQTEKETT